MTIYFVKNLLYFSVGLKLKTAETRLILKKKNDTCYSISGCILSNHIAVFHVILRWCVFLKEWYLAAVLLYPERVTTSEIQIIAFSAKEGVLLLVWCCLAFSGVKGILLLLFARLYCLTSR